MAGAMYTSRWLGFGTSSTVSKTLLHFFPSSIQVTAPYPIQTKIEVFSSDFGRNSICLDGPRLHQPDGVKLEAAFPILLETHGIYGIYAEFNASSQKIDISSSQCFFEQVTTMGRTLFQGVQISESIKRGDYFLIKDTDTLPSILIVNNGSKSFSYAGINNDESIVSAGSVSEITVQDSFYDNGFESITNKGISVIQRLSSMSFGVEDVAVFILERDISTKRIVSVLPIL